MKYRIIAVVVGVIASVFAMATPAQAYYTTQVRCVNYNGAWSGITTCFQVGFRTQDDGDGIRVEDSWEDTNNGCSSLNDGNEYNPASISVYDAGGFGPYVASQSFGADGCHVHHDLEIKGQDKGCQEVVLRYHARRDLYTDVDVEGSWDLCPNPERSSFNYMSVH